MFFKKKPSTEKTQLSHYANFVVEKVSPVLSSKRDAILDTAAKSFPKGVGEQAVQRALVKYGHATSQMIALVFATIIRDVRGKELTDIEYADCALAAAFCMRIPLRSHADAIDEIIDDWLTAFETDMHYLVFTTDEILVDLLEQGNNRYLSYENNADAKMPEAYLYLLATVMKQRESGEWEPYSFLDPMIGPDAIIFTDLVSNWQKVTELLYFWTETVRQAQEVAQENDLEIREWF